MRIFNATNSVLVLPLLINGSQKLEIKPRSVSTEFMGSIGFLTMIVTSFTDKQIAIIVSGPYELNVCANVPTAVNYVVQSLDDALRRFCLDKKEEKKEEVCQCSECKKEEVAEPEPESVEEPVEEEKPTEPEPEITEEPVKEETPVESEEVEEKPKTRKKRTSKK